MYRPEGFGYIRFIEEDLRDVSGDFGKKLGSTLFYG